MARNSVLLIFLFACSRLVAQADFPLPGPNGPVRVIKRVAGDYYVGGSFSRVGEVAANNVARWDGTVWHSIGDGLENGVNGEVNAIRDLGAFGLCVGGLFSQAGSVNVSNFAVWKQTQWVGEINFNGRVRVISEMNPVSHFLVGGDFTVAQGVAAPYLADVDLIGSSLNLVRKVATPTGGTLNGAVRAISFLGPPETGFGNFIYAIGGSFNRIGGQASGGLVFWDSVDFTQSGIHGFVNTIAIKRPVPDPVVIVGGQFVFCGPTGCTTNSYTIAEIPFSPTFPYLHDPGITGGNPPEVNAVVMQGDTVIVGGVFGSAGGNLVHNLARWDGRNWNFSPGYFGGGVSGPVYALAGTEGNLWVGGAFDQADYRPARNLANWKITSGVVAVSTDVSATPPTPSFDPALIHGSGGVYDFLVDGPFVYAVGNFTNAGGFPVDATARWNGVSWEPFANAKLGLGRGAVTAITSREGKIYLGGRFDSINGQIMSSLAKWDGFSWSQLGANFPSPGIFDFSWPSLYTDLRFAGETLYLSSGMITRPGHNLGQFDGNEWQMLRDPDDTSFNFDMNGVGGFSNGDWVWSLADFQGKLIVAGGFYRAGLIGVRNIASWNGQHFAPLGGGLGNNFNGATSGGQVYGLLPDGDRLFASGLFTNSLNIPLPSGVGQFDGSQWTAVGASAIDILPRRLVKHRMNLYAAGSARTAAARSAILRWNGSEWREIARVLPASSVVHAMAVQGDVLWLGGTFTQIEIAGSVSNANAVARINLAPQTYADYIEQSFDPSERANPALTGPDADADADGMTNQQEFETGTDPRSRQSVFAANGVAQFGEYVVITFPARANRTYTVQFRNLNETTWQKLTDVITGPLDRTATVLDNQQNASGRMYRIVTPKL